MEPKIFKPDETGRLFTLINYGIKQLDDPIGAFKLIQSTLVKIEENTEAASNGNANDTN